MLTADMMLFKILLNSVVSTPGEKFMTIDISNFYLNTPITCYEYVKMRLSDIQDKVVQEYQLHESGKVTADGFVCVEVRKGMYGLPQAGILAQQLLKRRLNDKGYFQSTLVLGLWKHRWRSVQFTLVVDDFRVKYVGKEHAQHLVDAICGHYDIEAVWEGDKYIGIKLDWDYVRRQVHLSMPGYIAKAFLQLHQPQPRKRQDTPHPHMPVVYGTKQQFATAPDGSPFLEKDGKLFIQQTSGKLQYLGRAVDPTILTALGTITAQQSKPTMDTRRKTK